MQKMWHRVRKWSTEHPWCERNGRPSASRTEVNAARVEELILENRRARIRDLSAAFHLSIGTVRSTVRELGSRKVCALWVPRCVTGEHKTDVSRLLFHILSCLKKKGTSSWNPHCQPMGRVYHFIPETKQAGMQWKHPTFARAQRYQGVSVCWQIYGIFILGGKRSHPR
jgi:hypothetical protein